MVQQYSITCIVLLYLFSTFPVLQWFVRITISKIERSWENNFRCLKLFEKSLIFVSSFLCEPCKIDMKHIYYSKLLKMCNFWRYLLRAIVKRNSFEYQYVYSLTLLLIVYCISMNVKTAILILV